MREPTGRYDRATRSLVLDGISAALLAQLEEAQRAGEEVRLTLAVPPARPEYDVRCIITEVRRRGPRGVGRVAALVMSGEIFGQAVAW